MLGETKYSVRLLWKDTAWSGTAECGGQTSALTTKSASVVAALLYNNGLIDLVESDAAVPEDLSAMAGCMATTGDVNVRAEPSTSGQILQTLPKDSPVAVTARTGEWYQVLFGDKLAYMSAQYLKNVN